MQVLAKPGCRIEEPRVGFSCRGERAACERHIIRDRLWRVVAQTVGRERSDTVAIAARGEPHTFCLWMGIVRISRRVQSPVLATDDVRLRIVLHSVLHPEQVAREPAVHQCHRGRAAVPTLMVKNLHRHPAILERLRDPVAVLGHDVPIVEAVRQERRSLHAVDVVQVVTLGPEIVVVASLTVVAPLHQFVTDGRVAEVPGLRVAAVDEVVEHVHVLTQIAIGRTHESVGPVVVVVRCVRCDGDDGLEAVDSCSGGGERERAVVRRPGHPDFARRPVGVDFVTATHAGEAARATVQPVDHRFGCE